MSEEIIFNEPWMRRRANDCRGAAKEIKGLLRPADTAAEKLKAAADGWEFHGSIGEMMKRWEDLNDLLREEFDEAADKIDECAGNHGRHEDTLEKIFKTLNPFD
jgi:hypothetical protein